MQLVKITAAPLDFSCKPTPEAIANRDALVAEALTFDHVPTNAEENEALTECGAAIQTLTKSTEKDGLELRRPLNSRADEIKGVQDSYLDPLRPHLKRLGSFAAAYRTEEERKAESERRARAEEITKLQDQERQAAEDAKKAAETGDAMGELVADIGAQALSDLTTAAISKPEPEAVKTPGQSFTERVLCWECTDPFALYRARPDLCEPIKPKASAIRAVCCPEMPVPGLRLWWESRVNFNSR